MIDWAKLVAQGRAKAHGISWSEEEAHARYVLGIPAEFVRSGILTTKDYEKTLAKDEKEGAPVKRQTRKQLEAAAKKLKIEFTPEVTDDALIAAIEAKDEKEGDNE